jgi:Rps23 Pro-64 3,4-dihydroxylase Tpa1-like proline 4-hydroxylase
MVGPDAIFNSPLPKDLVDPALRDLVLSIESYLRPSLRGANSAMDKVSARLAAGGLIVIRDAFEQGFAERMHQSLDSCKAWKVYEKYEEDFHYHHHNLYEEAEYPPDIVWCNKIFTSVPTKTWATRLSGRQCVGPTTFSASWYLPGDHSLPHDDAIASSAEANRQLAFVWHLAKDWRSEWGGALFWCSRALYLRPLFNTFVLFNVGPDTSHFVTQVSPYAQSKRLAINGWWTGPASTGTPIAPKPDRIDSDVSIEIY